MSVLVIDVEQAMAEAIAQALRYEVGISGAAAADRPRTAMDVLGSQPVDVLVVGLDADEEWDPLALVGSARNRRPRLPVVVMSDDDDATLVFEAVRAGATAWVPKHAHIDELAAAVIGVARGEASIPPVVLHGVLEIVSTHRGHDGGESALDRLTMRERQVLQHLADGLTRREIAEQQKISVNTVRTHVQRILTKLELHTTLEAVTLLLEERPVGDRPGP